VVGIGGITGWETSLGFCVVTVVIVRFALDSRAFSVFDLQTK
jgi:hypothetical protein